MEKEDTMTSTIPQSLAAHGGGPDVAGVGHQILSRRKVSRSQTDMPMRSISFSVASTAMGSHILSLLATVPALLALAEGALSHMHSRGQVTGCKMASQEHRCTHLIKQLSIPCPPSFRDYIIKCLH